MLSQECSINVRFRINMVARNLVLVTKRYFARKKGLFFKHLFGIYKLNRFDRLCL